MLICGGSVYVDRSPQSMATRVAFAHPEHLPTQPVVIDQMIATGRDGCGASPGTSTATAWYQHLGRFESAPRLDRRRRALRACRHAADRRQQW